jgi:hypothetical protein
VLPEPPDWVPEGCGDCGVWEPDGDGSPDSDSDSLGLPDGDPSVGDGELLVGEPSLGDADGDGDSDCGVGD